MICTLCESDTVNLHFKDKDRDYYICSNCGFLFVPKVFHLESLEEKDRYGLHENNPNDPHYREFLERLLTPLLNFIDPSMEGVDFGCGPGPTTSIILKEKGLACLDYDPYFKNDKTIFERTFDFVTCTEVVEHFNNPKTSWETMLSLLAQKSYLAVMTSFFSKELNLKGWHYKNDPTHISFYQEQTMQWIAGSYNLKIVHLERNIVIFQS